MSNLHLLLDEANKHTPKGFDNVGAKNYRPWKDELSESTYTENFQLPRAINFVDGTVAAPTSVNGDVYVLTGSGVIDSSWGTSTFGDWTRATSTIFTPITPTKGTICYDDTASVWKEFNGTVWAAAHFAITDGSGTTANGLSVDLGGPLTSNAIIDGVDTHAITLGSNVLAENLARLDVNSSFGTRRYLSSYPSGDGVTENITPGLIDKTVSSAALLVQHKLTTTRITDSVTDGTNTTYINHDSGVYDLINSTTGVTARLYLAPASTYLSLDSSAKLEFNSTNAVFTDYTAGQTGIQYAADYSATFAARSLVDYAYVNSVVASAKAYKGGYNAATNTPDLDVTPIAGITAGDVYDNTVVGTFFTIPLEVGDTLTAKQDSPTLESHWVVTQTNLTAASIKTQYESNADTNAYTDASKTKVDFITVTQAVDLDTIESDTALNNAKVSDIDHNATHTSEVTGATALTLNKTAVSNRTDVTMDATDILLFGDTTDTGNLKKGAVQDILDLVPSGGVSDGDKGDITVTASGATWTVDDEVVTFAKMQHIATDKILGRGTAGTGDVEELAISGDLQILLGVIGLNTTPLYISDVTTVNLLDDVANWDLNGNYTGVLIADTFQGQNHYNSTYKFECVLDNVWIRLGRI